MNIPWGEPKGEDITDAQLERVRRMAKDKGIGQKEFKLGLDNGVVVAMLDNIKYQVEQESFISLLTEISTVKIPAIKKFVAAEHFKSNSARIKFCLSLDFKKYFLNKVEENIPTATLTIYRLRRNSKEKLIREALGKREEIFLGQLFELIKLQSRDQAGKLLTNGYANIFYIRDANNDPWAVSVDWYSNENPSGGLWNVTAYSDKLPHEWREGHRVLAGSTKLSLVSSQNLVRQLAD